MNTETTPKVPKRWLGLLLAAVLTGGIGHFYLGLKRRALVWVGVQTVPLFLLATATVMLDGSVVAYGGIAVFSVLTRLGQFLDIAFLKRDRFTRASTVGTFGFGLLSLGLLYGMQVLLKANVVEAFKIPSASMAPTLMPSDHIVVDKTARGSREGTAARGQLIVFEFPDPNPDHPRVDYLKRVVGLPGDRVELRQGHPIINGWPVPSCLVSTLPLPNAGLDEGTLYVEFLGDHSYLTFYQANSGVDAEGPYTVSPGQVFVLGDNRWNSSDSRSWDAGQGAGLPADSIKGRALSVWLSFDDAGSIAWDRIGLELEAAPRIPGAPAEVSQAIARCMANRPTHTLPPG